MASQPETFFFALPWTPGHRSQSPTASPVDKNKPFINDEKRPFCRQAPKIVSFGVNGAFYPLIIKAKVNFQRIKKLNPAILKSINTPTTKAT